MEALQSPLKSRIVVLRAFQTVSGGFKTGPCFLIQFRREAGGAAFVRSTSKNVLHGFTTMLTVLHGVQVNAFFASRSPRGPGRTADVERSPAKMPNTWKFGMLQGKPTLRSFCFRSHQRSTSAVPHRPPGDQEARAGS